MSGLTDLFKICRTNQQLSIRQAAKEINVSPTTLCKLESSRRCNIRVEILIKVCNLYDLNMEPILSLIEIHNEHIIEDV